MAEENSITTIFKADISQFSSSAQDLKRYVNQVNSEFNDAVAGMGKWSDSTDGIQAKLTQLKGVLKAEQKTLSDLEEQYNSLTDEQKKNTNEGQRLATKINNQRAVVKKTEKQIGDYTASLEELESAGVSTRQELDKLDKTNKKVGDGSDKVGGKILKGLGKGLAGIATTAVGAVGGFLALGESTRELRTELGQLETAFNSAGHSADTAKDTYNELFGVLGDSGKATEASMHLAQIATNQEELDELTNSLTGAYARFGDSLPIENIAEGAQTTLTLGQANAGMVDAIEFAGGSVDEFNAQLQSLTSEEEKRAFIIETLNGLYGEAGEQYKETNKDVIEAREAQARLSNAIAQLGAVAEPIMTILKNSLADLIELIHPFVSLIGDGLREAFSGSAEGAKTFADGLSGIVNVLVEKVNDLLPTLTGIIMALIPSLIGVVLGALPSLLETLSTAVSDIVSSLGEMIPQVIQGIIDSLPLVMESLLNALPQLLGAVQTLIIGIVEALPTLIQSLVSAIPQIIDSIIQTMMSLYPQMISASIAILMAIVEAIPTIIQAIVPQIPTIVNSIINGLLGMLPVLLQASITLLMAIVQAIPTIVQALIPQVPTIVSTIVSTLLSRLPDIINGAIQLFMAILQAIPVICGELIANMPQIISSIVQGLMAGIGDIADVGLKLVEGLWEGIKNAGNWLMDQLKSFGDWVVDGLKGIFGIHSPSKVFKDEIGKNLALGLGEGFGDGMASVQKDMEKVVGKIAPNLGVNLEGIDGVNSMSSSVNGALPSKFAELLGLAKTQNVVNNYSFDYKFERMESTRLAIHKAQLETKRLVGGH
jgi:phage-related protein